MNADLIAAGLSPLAPQAELTQASRLFLREIKTHRHAFHDFAFETTLAGRGYLRLIKNMRREGWHIELIYLALFDVHLSVERVTQRVAEGGHNIPAAAIRRRFPRSLANLFNWYTHVCDRVICYDNTDNQPQAVFEQLDGQTYVYHQTMVAHLQQEACQ